MKWSFLSSWQMKATLAVISLLTSILQAVKHHSVLTTVTFFVLALMLALVALLEEKGRGELCKPVLIVLLAALAAFIVPVAIFG